MSSSSARGIRPDVKTLFDTSGFLVPLLVYCAFAAIVYVIHGPDPTLNIDHISYIRLADEIRTEFPNGDYWRSYNTVRAYGVLLAYVFPLTGSHLVSFKLLLAAITVAYLFAFQLFMGLATASRARAMLFSLFSALFVSFGAAVWGMTDFAASLNRSIIVPFVIVLVWFFFRHFHSPWRYAAFPALIGLSLLHLSALHVYLVLGAFELLDFLFRRRCRIDRNLAHLALAIVASLALQAIMENIGNGTGSYIRYVLNMAVPIAEAPKPAPPAAAPAAGAPTTSAGAAATGAGAPAIEAPAPPVAKAPDRLTYQEAWRIERLAFPWRNVPPSLATIATMASSFGVIFLLALAGAFRAFRPGVAKPLDRQMATFACAVPLAAYGLQTVIYLTRDVMPIMPVNFEEVRAINMIMIPAVYFIFRLYELATPLRSLSPGVVRVAILVAFALQPIVVVRSLPAPWREGIIQEAVAQGLLRSSDAPRMLYARQLLGLAGEGRRFYYSSRPAMEWLERHAGPDDVVLTNLNEFHMSGVKTAGPFLGIVNLQVWELSRTTWAESVEATDRALATKDLAKVLSVARSLGATYAVVDWPVEGAAYRDEFYSVVRVP